MTKLLFSCLLPLIYIVILIFPVVSWADELDDTTNTLNQKQSELQKAKEALEGAKQRELELAGGLTPLQAALNTAVAEVELKQAEVNATLADLDNQEQLLKKQRTLRDIRIRELYKKVASDKANEVVSLLDADNLVTFAKVSAYQSQVLAEEERLILDLGNQVTKIDQKRVELQRDLDHLDEEKRLAQQKVDNLRYQINVAKNQQYNSNNQIAALGKDIQGLSAKQAQLVQAKIAANAARSTVGDHDTISTQLPDPGFAPAYAFASYGYPHRIGMSQYGAKGRAEAGQNYQQILKTYYKDINVGSYSTPATVTVNGYSPEYNQTFNNETYAFEEYLKHLYEMPASWPMEALKAQAVAARSYTLNWLNSHGGGAICPSQSCQVVKHEINDTRWQQAVDATAGIVATHNGSPIAAWYSSTVGGYTQSSAQVWGGVTGYTHVVRDYVGSWPAGGYDKDSPWYHKAWGARDGGAYNPWLTKAETVDLLNAMLLYQQTGQTTAGDYDLSGPASGGTGPEGIVNALNTRGIQPIGDFQLLTMNHNDGTGQTDALNVIGGPRNHTILNGASVKKVFNLRSPGTLGLMSTLFDVISR